MTPVARGGSRTAARLLLDYLKREGIRAVFGIPGGPVTPLFDALYDEPALKTFATRHEAGAAAMAAGYARLSRGPGACFLTTGPGATNALTSIAAARADSLPVLAVTAQVPTSTFARGSLQDSAYERVDVVQMYRAVTKMSAMVPSAAAFPAMLRQALREACAARPGPVHLNIPSDVMRGIVDEADWAPSQYRPAARCFDRAAIQRAARLLLSAKHPAILAGHGANLADAQPELIELAETLRIPVATTPRGKGAFPEAHRLALRVFGIASSPRAERYLLSGIDVLVVVGSGLHEISTQAWEPALGRAAVIQIDVDPAAVGRTYPVEAALIGDAKTTLRELLFQIRRSRHHGAESVPVENPSAMDGPAYCDPDGATSVDFPLRPQRLIRDLAESLPDDAAIFLDVGNHALWALHYLDATGRNCFVHNWGDFAAMGYGLAAAVGGKIASPERPVVAIVGDGGFGMAGMEVLTAVTYSIPVVWVVFNDARYNTVHHGQTMQYRGRTIGTEFSRMDVAGIAAGLGARAFRVTRAGEASEALAAALSSGEPCVIDAWIDADVVPPIQSRVAALERFFAGLATV